MKNNEGKKDKEEKNNSIENKARDKIKEYFNKYKSLLKDNFTAFIQYIGLSEIWSAEEEKNIFWEKLIQNSENKTELDYDTVLKGFNEFFEEEVNYDESENNNNLSFNENDNDLLMDLDLQSLHMKSIGFETEKNEKEDENYKKSIEEFINNIKDSQNKIYAIRFINEIFFTSKINQNNFEKNIENNYDDENFFINKEEIINEIKSKYNFINLGNDFFNSYFNIISKQKDEANIELVVEKSHLNYLNGILKNMNNVNDKKNSLIKPINLNLIKSNNINISSNLDKLKEYDSIINQCIAAIKNLNLQNSFIDLAQEYIEKYIIKLKNNIYEEIKLKDKEYEAKLLNLDKEIKVNNINKNIVKNINKLENRNEKLIKENNEQLNEIDFNQIKELKEKESKNNFNISKKEFSEDSKNIQHKTKNKIIIPPLKIKINKEEERKFSNDYNNNDINNEIIYDISNSSKKNIKIYDNKIQENRINSTNDVLLEDLTNSDIDLFSINDNKITDQFLLDTTRLCNEGDDLNKINENKNFNHNKNEKDGLNYSNGNISIGLSNINKQEYKDEYFEDELYDNICFNENEKMKNNFPLTDRNQRKIDYQLDYNLNIDNYYRKQTYNNKVLQSQTYLDMNVNRILQNKRKSYTNEDMFYGYVNKAKCDFYDFKYLSRVHEIKKLFHSNKEKLMKNEFFSDEVKACFANNKKKSYILIITFRTFYFLKKNESYDCIIKLNVNSLISIIVSKKNFNMLNLSFRGGTDVIIETCQRIEMLRFLQSMLNKGIIKKDLEITASNDFFMTKKDGTKEKISTIKNKSFSITPNFENAQKIGVLLKYKEGFFSSYFQEKLFVLCSIGLIIFEDDYKTPKSIIPIVGTTIKFIVVQFYKRIYCLKMKTINEENYIVGSYQKKEIFDWLKEFADYKKTYHLNMKQINPNFVSDSSTEFKYNISEGFY